MADLERNVFEVKFYHGYSFRGAINFINSNIAQGNFRISSSGIKFMEANSSETMLIKTHFRSEDLPGFEYNSYQPERFIGVNMASLNAITKNVEKKGSAYIWYPNRDTSEEQYLHVSRGNESESGRGDFNLVPVTKVPIQDYAIPNEPDVGAPNFSVPVSEFVKACSLITVSTNGSVFIRGFDSGIMLQNSVNDTGTIQTLGKCDVGESRSTVPSNTRRAINSRIHIVRKKVSAELFKISIPGGQIKSLKKINSFCPEGVVKFYYVDNAADPETKIIKLLCDIGHYGSMSIYLLGSLETFE